MIGAGGLTKVVRGFQMAFPGKKEKKKKEYKDKFPKKLPTLEDIKKKHGVVVWCKYAKCKNYQEIKGLQRTSSTILKNLRYQPINEQDHIWEGICTRNEIAIKYEEVITASRTKIKVPHCFTSSTKSAGKVDFTKFLNPDGSALGGNIDSQHVSDEGYGALDSNNIYE